MDGNADVGIPLCQFAAERCASRNKFFGVAAHAGAHFRKDQSICNLPGERCWPLSDQNLAAMSSPYRNRPAIDCVFWKARSFQNHLLTNLFVDTRYSNKDVRPQIGRA